MARCVARNTGTRKQWKNSKNRTRKETVVVTKDDTDGDDAWRLSECRG